MDPQLISVIKGVSKDSGDPTLSEVSIFALRDFNAISFVGKKIFLSREGKICGEYEVLEQSMKSVRVRRLSGEEPAPYDAFFAELEAPKETEMKSTVEAKVFQGTNWKLASDKKWKPKSVEAKDFNGSSLGEKDFDGKKFQVYKTDDGFVAVPAAS